MIILDTMRIIKRLLGWLPALAFMVIIFGFSSIPSREMPTFGLWDLLIKKGAHMVGYGFLALAYWIGLGFKKHRWWLALLLAVLYAFTDEFHQSYVAGRHSSWVDALVIDGSGAAIALGLASWLRVEKRIHLRNG